MFKTLHTQQYTIFLKTLRKLRLDAHVTQVELAERLNINQAEVSKCELGVRRMDVIELKIWLEALGTTFLAFVTELDSQLESGAVINRKVSKKSG